MTVKQMSSARVERELATVVAGQRVAGAEPTQADLEAARAVLERRMTADQAVAKRLAEIGREFGISR